MTRTGDELRSWFPLGRYASWREQRERRDPYGLNGVWRWPWLTSGLSVAVLLVAFTTPLGLWAVLAWLAWLGARWLVGSLARRVRPLRVAAWELLPGGLHEVLANGRRQVHPWESILGWEPTPEAVTVRTRSGTLRFAGQAADRRDLGRALAHYLAQPRAQGEPLTAAEIASWLELEEGESLRVGLPWWRGTRHAKVMVGMAAAQLLLALGGSHSALRWALPLFTLYWYLFCAEWVGKWVRVSAYGLAGQGCRIGWDEIESVTDLQLNPDYFLSETIVTAGERRIVLRGALRPRVGEVAARVLAAKQAGAVLPRMADIPDRAISRAESVDLSAERGISRVE